MSGVFRDHSYGSLDDADGSVEAWGSRTSPIKETSLTAANIDADRKINIPSGDLVTLWEYGADDETFEFMRVVIAGGSGFLDLYWLCDLPTDAAGGDLSPSGTAEHWCNVGLSCFSDHKFTSQTVGVNTTLATAAGDSSGSPALAAARSDGMIYKVVAKNRGTSDVPIKFTRIS